VSAQSIRAKLERLNDLPAVGMVTATELVEKIAREEGGRYAMHLGKKKRRVRLTAITRIKRSTDSAQATVWGVPTGPWVWVTSGAGAHLIPKRKPTARNPRPMFGQGFEHPVQRMQLHHPGSHGRGAWRAVQERARREVPDIFREEVRKMVNQ
jgi:hypothetical protein